MITFNKNDGLNVCDGCGKKAKPGDRWFTALTSDSYGLCILACSKKCRKLPWKKATQKSSGVCWMKTCQCDTCDKEGFPTSNQKAPVGWFYIAGKYLDKEYVFRACSIRCQKVNWT